MASLTQRVKQIIQPYGGYLPVKNFEKTKYDDRKVLNQEENLHAYEVWTSS